VEFLLGAVLGAAGAGFAALAWVEQKANRREPEPAALPVGAYESVRKYQEIDSEALGERPSIPGYRDY
jgi:hypothetical protein